MTTQLWFDADDAATITLATGVSQWDDKSGNARHVAQATGSFQPSLVANEQNGLDVIRFDGTDDRLRCTSGLTGLTANTNGVLLATVRKWPSSPSASQILIGIGTATADTSRQNLLGGATASRSGVSGRRVAADAGITLSSGSDMSNGWEVQLGTFDYTNTDLFLHINGTLAGSNTSFYGSANTENTVPINVTVGASVNSSAAVNAFFAGDIGELICAQDIQTTLTYHRRLFEGYLAWRWGLETSLPTSHPYRYWRPQYGDSNYASVVFLAHYEGPDTSTAAMADSGITSGTPTVNGNAQIDTAQFPPIDGATSSLLLDGSGDYVTYPDSPNWDFDTGDFTIECWVRFNSTSGNQTILSQYDASSNRRAWILLINATTGILQYFHTTDGTTGTAQSVSTSGSWASAGVWYHLAVTRSGTTLRLFIDGVVVSTNSSAGGNVFDSNQPLYVGSRNGGGDAWLNGWIKDVRITKGLARYTANFTRPTEVFKDAI